MMLLLLIIMLGRLDCGKLFAAVLTTLQKVCRNWSCDQPQLTVSPGGKYIVSIHAIKNSRRKMEDRHECYVNVNPMFGLEVW